MDRNYRKLSLVLLSLLILALANPIGNQVVADEVASGGYTERFDCKNDRGESDCPIPRQFGCSVAVSCNLAVSQIPILRFNNTPYRLPDIRGSPSADITSSL